jgi:ribosome modulation factor
MSQEEKAKMVLDDLGDRLPEQYDMEDIRGRVDEVTPYAMVAIQVRWLGGSSQEAAAAWAGVCLSQRSQFCTPAPNPTHTTHTPRSVSA